MSILLCYDGSPSAKYAIEAARRTLTTDSVTLLHVYNLPDQVQSDAFGDDHTETGASDEQLDKLAAARAEQLAAEGREFGNEHGLDLRPLTRPVVGSEWQTILHVADELDCDLIVLGAHPRGEAGPTLERVSDAVLEHSCRPVLVVPAVRSV